MRLLNAFVKWISRLLMPQLAADMEREGVFDFRTREPGDWTPEDFVQVEDNGSDVTIISFAGMAVLIAGMPTFEFRKLLKDAGPNYNLVFVRDPFRACYFQAPDGTATGIDFYEGLLRDVLARLGSRYNVALGASIGGAGAFYASTRLPVQHIITFSPGFPQEVYLHWRSQLHSYFNFAKLFTEPWAYFEVAMVSLGGNFVWRRMMRLMGGPDKVVDVTAAYLAVKPEPPRAVIFYGSRCRPDRMQAEALAHIPTVHLRPVDSGRHNCAGDLKKRGQLGPVIMEEVQAGLAAFDAAGSCAV